MRGDVPLISVVFPVYDNVDTLKVTLPAILSQDLPSGLRHEVIVVDDGSAPATADWLAAQTHPNLRLWRQPVNSGRAAARNAGVCAARGEALVFLDSDVIVRRDFLAAHAHTLGLAGEEGCDISIGRLMDTDSLADADTRPLPAPRPGLPHFTTANVALRAGLLASLAPDGPFDAATFTRYGWEDLDLERRLAPLHPRKRRAQGAVGFHICPPFSARLLPAMIEKEIDRAAMARAFYAKHPTLGVRLVIQNTPLHRLMWEILSLGGLLNARSLDPVLGWLVRNGHAPLAEGIARLSILNPTYVRHL